MPGTETKHKVRDVNVRMLRGGSGPPLLFCMAPTACRSGCRCSICSPSSSRCSSPSIRASAPRTTAWLRNIGDLAMYYLDFLDGFGPHEVHLAGSRSVAGPPRRPRRETARGSKRCRCWARRHPHQGHAERRQLHLGPEEAIRNLSQPGDPRSDPGATADRRAGRHPADQPLRHASSAGSRAGTIRRWSAGCTASRCRRW